MVKEIDVPVKAAKTDLEITIAINIRETGRGDDTKENGPVFSFLGEIDGAEFPFNRAGGSIDCNDPPVTSFVKGP